MMAAAIQSTVGYHHEDRCDSALDGEHRRAPIGDREADVDGGDEARPSA
jgi:hypothetical protein